MFANDPLAIALRELISTRLNEDEVKNLCFALDVDYEDLSGAGKSGRIRELILFLQRRQRLDDLIKAIKKERPDVHVTMYKEGRRRPKSRSKRTDDDVIKNDAEEISNLGQRVPETLATVKAWVRSAQNPDGGLPSDDEGSVSCAWTTSGLLWAMWEGGEDLSSYWARLALDWVLLNRNADGGIPIVVRGDNSITDATAQTGVACALRLGDRPDDRIRAELAECIEWLLYHRLAEGSWNWRPSAEGGWCASAQTQSPDSPRHGRAQAGSPSPFGWPHQVRSHGGESFERSCALVQHMPSSLFEQA